MQGNIYEIFEIGEPSPTLKPYRYKTHEVESSFIDLPWPELVDYSLIKLPWQGGNSVEFNDFNQSACWKTTQWFSVLQLFSMFLMFLKFNICVYVFCRSQHQQDLKNCQNCTFPLRWSIVGVFTFIICILGIACILSI